MWIVLLVIPVMDGQKKHAHPIFILLHVQLSVQRAIVREIKNQLERVVELMYFHVLIATAHARTIPCLTCVQLGTTTINVYLQKNVKNVKTSIVLIMEDFLLDQQMTIIAITSLQQVQVRKQQDAPSFT